ncbi:hypothetical protein OPT61_g7775 [Boeremia exigua]|uniref:Uncharacterized protein n=1 Tax=Boeremia exigua TaxID=749465 RepID=A0ACC2I191_9PLEO|nr:hypothetical protein OPT61_g7775 [Boeremia exigua]
MKLTIHALGALSLASFAGAQNGNDPLIVNNRTGLSPVVYSTFTTLYTSLFPPVSDDVSSLSTHLTTVIKPTMPVECERTYGQRVRKRLHRPIVNGCIPPPEFFSTRPSAHLPGPTNSVNTTSSRSLGLPSIAPSLSSGHTSCSTDSSLTDFVDGTTVWILPIPSSLLGGGTPSTPSSLTDFVDGTVGILPIPTSLLGESTPCATSSGQTDIADEITTTLPCPTDERYSILPIKTSPLGDTSCVTPSSQTTPPCQTGITDETPTVPPSPTDERFSILPIETPSLSVDAPCATASKRPSETDEDIYSILPVYPTSAPQNGLPTEGPRGPIQRHSSHASIAPSQICDLHYCPDGTPIFVTAPPCTVSPSSTEVLPSSTEVLTQTLATSSHFAIPPALAGRHADSGTSGPV